MSDFKDNVKVAIRIRPLNEREISENTTKCVSIVESKIILLDSKPESRSFTYDNVAGDEVSQEEVFEIVGKSITSSCLRGYNGTIFAYGQTGAGKTYTIQGEGYEEYSLNVKVNYHLRGILPRCFEYLFSSIADEISRKNAQYLIKCSFLEIYQEQINDLLDQNPRNLQLREDMKKGVYVEGLIEETVGNVMETYELLNTGSQNRHVSYTNMNKESSRSHSVFTLIIESKTSIDGLVNFRTSRFHLIDLAGSERQKATDCAGERLKEAGMINKSLSALGNVINSLVDISEGKSRHVHYRDSKLTFLLKDSLGGNSKTFIIANISPSVSAFAETLSTLKFAQRAKMIKNAAIVNEDVSGTVNLLKFEIKKLKDELSLQKSLHSEILTICPTCSSMMSRNIDLFNLIENTKELELLLEKNTRLRISSEKQFEMINSEKEKQLKALKSVLSKIESKANHDRMVLKFRDATIAKLQGTGDCDEIENLKKENLSLREQIENNPVAAQLFVENEKLKAECEALKKECKYDADSLNGRIRDGYDYAERICDSLKLSAEEKIKILRLIDIQNKENEENKAENEKLKSNLTQKIQSLEAERNNLLDRIKYLLKLNDKRSTNLDEEENLIKSAEKIEELMRGIDGSWSVTSASNYETEISELKAVINTLNSKSISDNNKIKDLEEKLTITQQELNFYTEKSENKENQLNQNIQEIENLTDSCEYLKSNINILNKTIHDKSQLIIEHEGTIQRLENQLSEIIHSNESTLELETLTSKIEDLEKTKERLTRSNFDLQNEKKKLESLYEASHSQEMIEKKLVSDLHKKLGNAISELEESKEREKSLLEETEIVDELKHKIIELESELQNVVITNSDLIQSLHKKILDEESTSKNLNESKSELSGIINEKIKLINSLEIKLQEEIDAKEEVLSQKLQLDEDSIIQRVESDKHIEKLTAFIEDIEEKMQIKIKENQQLEIYIKEIENELEISKEIMNCKLQLEEILKQNEEFIKDLKNSLENERNSNEENIIKRNELEKEIENLKLINEELQKDKQKKLKKTQKLSEQVSKSENELEKQKGLLDSITEVLKGEIQKKIKDNEELVKKNDLLVFITGELKGDIQKKVEENECLETKIRNLENLDKKNKILVDQISKLEASTQELKLQIEIIRKENIQLQEKNIALEKQILELNELKESLENQLTSANEEIESLKDENSSKMEVLKNTNKNILSTRHEINMWKKCIDDKNLLIQELNNELRKKDDELLKYTSGARIKNKNKRESPEDDEVSENKYLKQLIQKKDKDLKDLKEKGQEYYSQADEALESQRKEIEIFTRRCASLQGEVKRLKEELRSSMKDREFMLEELKKLKNDEYKSFRNNEDSKKMLNQLREEKTRLLIDQLYSEKKPI